MEKIILLLCGNHRILRSELRPCSSVVEHLLGKQEDTGSTPVAGSD